jgi:hypothetical protein
MDDERERYRLLWNLERKYNPYGDGISVGPLDPDYTQ